MSALASLHFESKRARKERGPIETSLADSAYELVKFIGTHRCRKAAPEMNQRVHAARIVYSLSKPALDSTSISKVSGIVLFSDVSSPGLIFLLAVEVHEQTHDRTLESSCLLFVLDVMLGHDVKVLWNSKSMEDSCHQ